MSQSDLGDLLVGKGKAPKGMTTLLKSRRGNLATIFKNLAILQQGQDGRAMRRLLQGAGAVSRKSAHSPGLAATFAGIGRPKPPPKGASVADLFNIARQNAPAVAAGAAAGGKKGIGKTAGKYMFKAFKALNKVPFKIMGKTLEFLGKGFLNAVNMLGGAFLSGFLEPFSAISEVAGGLGSLLATGFTPMIIDIVQILMQGAPYIMQLAGWITELWNAIKLVFDGAASGPALLNSILSTILTNLSSWFASLLTFILETFPVILQIIIDNIPLIINTIVTAIPMIVDVLFKAIPILLNALWQALPLLWEGIIDIVASLFKSLKENILYWVFGIGEESSAAMADATDKIVGAVEESAEQRINGKRDYVSVV